MKYRQSDANAMAVQEPYKSRDCWGQDCMSAMGCTCSVTLHHAPLNTGALEQVLVRPVRRQRGPAVVTTCQRC